MNDETKRLVDLMDGFDDAMFTTRALDGALRSRPMHIAEHCDDGRILFVTAIDSGKVDELTRHPEIVVVCQKSNTYLSISGRAEIRTDRDAIDQAWSESMKVWFPDGKDSADLAVVEVIPHDGEYWNFNLRDRFAFLVEAGKALVKGEKAYQDDDEIAAEHAKVDFDETG